MFSSLKGNEHDYRVLLREVEILLRRYFRRRLGTVAEIDDLIQETLLALHTRRATYDTTLPFTAWLHAIARYKMIDHLRRRKVRLAIPLDDAGALLAEDDLEPVMAARDMRHILATLPEPQRSLVRAVKLEGRSIASVALTHGMTESAVKVRVHRALLHLSARFRGQNSR